MLEPDASNGLKRSIELDRLLPSVKQSLSLRSAEQSSSLVHIAGQSAVGKSTISNLLVAGLANSSALNLDDYLRGLEAGPLNHDSGDPNKPFFAGLNPAVYDLDQLYKDLVDLREGRGIQKPLFDEVTKNRIGTSHFPAAEVLIFEGIYALSSPFRDLASLGILVEAPLHDRLVRKLVRNHLSYQQEVDGIVERYLSQDEPTYAFYRRELHDAADFVVENPANPVADYHPLLQARDVVYFGTRSKAAPKPEFGALHPSESLNFASNNQGEVVLQYGVDDKLLISSPIAPTTYNLIQKFYTIAEGE